MSDLIDRQQAIRAFDDAGFCSHDYLVSTLKDLPPAQPELLTDNEKRIFLAAMSKEEKIRIIILIW